jgi:ABC-type dipeptide/oligopeptide/nickel transport system ATPase component
VRVDADCRGVEAIAADVAEAVGDATRVVLVGRAGCGKSVQGGRIMAREDGTGPVHISTGEMLRMWARQGAEQAESANTSFGLASLVRL